MSGWTRREGGLVATAALLVFSRVFGLSLVLPNFKWHYLAEFEATGTMVGLAFGAYGLTMALMQWPAGVLSDRYGRRLMLFVSSTLFVAGSVAAAFAPSMGWLIAARLAQGLGAISSVAMAAVGETIPAHRRTLAMALIGIPAGAGFLLGMGIGPLLYPVIGMKGLFLLTAGIGIAAMAPVPWLHFAPNRAHETPRIVAPVVALAFVGFVSNYTLTTTLFFLPTTRWQVLLPMLAVALVLVGGLSRRVDKAGWKLGPVAVGILVIGLAAGLFSQAAGAWLYVTGALFFTAHAILQSVIPSQVSRIAGPSGGRGHGTQNVIAYLGTFVAGPIAGWLLHDALVAFGLVMVLAIVASVGILAVRPQA